VRIDWSIPALESELIAFLQQGDEDFERGDFVTHEALVVEISALRDSKDAA
jgi:hypothetical protein